LSFFAGLRKDLEASPEAVLAAWKSGWDAPQIRLRSEQWSLAFDRFQIHFGLKCGIMSLSHVDHFTIPPPSLLQVKMHLIALSKIWREVRILDKLPP